MKRAIVHNLEKAKGKVKKHSVLRDLLLFVALPTLIATLYYYVIAADVYVSETKFSVNVEGQSFSASPLGMLMPTFNMSNNSHESMVVQEYIQSRPMMEKLIKTINLKQIFDNPKADVFSRIPSDLKTEEYLERYKGRLEIVMDETSGIISLKAKAFTAEDSRKFAEALLDESEDFVNNMVARVRQDSIKFAKSELDKSEKMVLDVSARITKFRNENNNFDPTSTTKSVLLIAGKLEEELAKTNAEIGSLRNYMKPNSPKIMGLQAKAAAIKQQMEEQSGRLANKSGANLADITEQYEALNIEREFTLSRLKVALSSYESAQVEAIKKDKYLIRIVEPSLPEEAIEPNRPLEILTIFFWCLIGYTLGGLIIAAIKDHIRP